MTCSNASTQIIKLFYPVNLIVQVVTNGDRCRQMSLPDSEYRKEVVHHDQIPDQPASKQTKNASDKKSSFTIKAKSIPATPKTIASSQGVMRERWLVFIYKEIENFLQNMAIKDADPSLVVKWKSCPQTIDPISTDRR